MHQMGCYKLTYRPEKPVLNVVKGDLKSAQKGCAGYYRYGFNGMEKDDEIYGEGNSYTATFWQYDARLGRRWNVDPVVKHHESSYARFSNNSLIMIDPKGDNADWYQGEEGLVWSSQSEDQISFNGSIYKNLNKGSDVLPIMLQGTNGANVAMVGRDNFTYQEFDKQTVNTANGTGNGEMNVYAIVGNKNDFTKALEVITSNFGQINNAFIRSHGQADGLILGDWSSDNFRISDVPVLTKKISDGLIKMNQNSTFYFMGCNMFDLAQAYKESTGLNSVGSIGSTGPNDAFGTYRVDPEDYRIDAGWYRFESRVILLKGICNSYLGKRTKVNF